MILVRQVIKSFLQTSDLNPEQLSVVFAKAKLYKQSFLKTGVFPELFSKKTVIALLFFEASTRTRLSFEMASQRLGGSTTFFDGASKEGTSLIKGESLEDTFWTVHAMMPDAIVVRCGDEFPLYSVRDKTQCALINGGLGTVSHPTQALLDVFTMLEFLPSLNDKNILFIGDASHSRVVASHRELLPQFGAHLGVLGPSQWTSSLDGNIRKMTDLNEALEWADVVMGLRIQSERHQDKNSFSTKEFIEKYQIHKKHGALLKPSTLLMHPGPVNWGVEFDPSVRELLQFKMWDQKTNGVFVRAALMTVLLGGSPHV